MQSRVRLARVRNATQSQLDALVGSQGGYDAGKLNRLTKGRSGQRMDENAVPRAQVGRLRWQSWNLYRNNPHARKIVRTLEAKVVGRGLSPQSQAVDGSGNPHRAFRERAQQLWRDIGDEIDQRGRPGFGGLHLTDLQKAALRAVILGGEVLTHYRPITDAARRRRRLTVPLQAQLVHADRLYESHVSDSAFHGIELDPLTDRRTGYHLWTRHPADPRGPGNPPTITIPADSMSHLYVVEDVDQLRGVPWFSAALLKMRDTGDYEFNELTAAAMSACVVLGYRRATGQSEFGLAASDSDELTDDDGNEIKHIQPGMFVDLGADGDLTGFNPQRPSSDAPEFISHLLRSEAAGVPGVKGSTLTGDYRRASFASERSADNDAWPELEGVQDWFAFNWCQPLYEKVVEAAFMAGYFSGVVSDAEFSANRKSFLAANWQGPVALSINPKDDAEAARERVRNGSSSVQREAAKLGRNWREIVKERAEFREFAEEQGLTEDDINQMLGIEQNDMAPDEQGTEPNGQPNNRIAALTGGANGHG